MHEFKDYDIVNAKINGKSYKLYVADNTKKMSKGLSEIDALPEKTGMIFIYDKPVTNNFTMKNTKIPLNIIFLDENMKIVDYHSCKPFQEEPVRSRKKYQFVIEITHE